MTHLVFLAARTFPYWAIPIAVVFFQLARHFARRHSHIRFYFYGFTLALILLTGAWLYYRGDRNSDLWVRIFIQEY